MHINAVFARRVACRYRPDLLLLDEPTNMLDMKAIIWLEVYLQTWPTTLLVVSHDRAFLNTISTDVVHLTQKRLENYRGNYENFLKARDEKLKNQQREYDAQMDYRKHVQVRASSASTTHRWTVVNTCRCVLAVRV